MIELTEPQVWTAISVLSTAVFAMITLMGWLFVRVLRAEIGALRAEIGALRAEIGAVRSEIDVVRSEIGVVRAEIRALDDKLTGRNDALDDKLTGQISALDGRLTGEIGKIAVTTDYLDRDVRLLIAKVFPDAS